MKRFRLAFLGSALLAGLTLGIPASLGQPQNIVGDLPDEQPNVPFGPPEAVVFSQPVRELMMATAQAFWTAFEQNPNAETLALGTEIIAPTDLPEAYVLFGNEIKVFEQLYAARIAALPPGDTRAVRTIIDADPIARALLREYMTTYTLRTDPAVHGADVHAAHAAMLADAIAASGIWAIDGGSAIDGAALTSHNLMTSASAWVRPSVFRVPTPWTSEDDPSNANVPRCVRGVYRTNLPVWEIAPSNPAIVPVFDTAATQVFMFAWVENVENLCQQQPIFNQRSILMGETAGGSLMDGGWEISLRELGPSTVPPVGTQPICGVPAGGIWTHIWRAEIRMERGVERNFDIKPEGIGAGLGWRKRKTTSHFTVQCSIQAGCHCRPAPNP